VKERDTSYDHIIERERKKEFFSRRSQIGEEGLSSRDQLRSEEKRE
jgi:hypothetical protein